MLVILEEVSTPTWRFKKTFLILGLIFRCSGLFTRLITKTAWAYSICYFFHESLETSWCAICYSWISRETLIVQNNTRTDQLKSVATFSFCSNLWNPQVSKTKQRKTISRVIWRLPLRSFFCVIATNFFNEKFSNWEFMNLEIKFNRGLA